MGGASLIDNVRKGNYGWAAVDALGLVVDGLATAVPVVPGGVGTLLKTSRISYQVASKSKIAFRQFKPLNNIFRKSYTSSKLSNTSLISTTDVTPLINSLSSTKSSKTILNTTKQNAVKFTNSVKGNVGGLVANNLMFFSRYKQLPSKVGSNNGIDGVFVKYGNNGDVLDIILNESKYAKNGKLSLTTRKFANSEGKITQMSQEWFDINLGKMLDHKDGATRATARLIENNMDKVRRRANVLDEKGINRWYDLDKKFGGKLK